MFGIRMKNKKDCAIADVVSKLILNDIMEEREEMRVEVRANIATAQANYKKDFDKRSKKANIYKLGDLVAIKCTQFLTVISISH